MKPAIIIIGGYNSIWAAYLKMARDLEDITGLRAVGVPLITWHWWQARRTGDATHLLQKVEETVAWARRKFRAERFILVGHSAGGLLGRLYLHDGPVWGHTYAGVEHVIALITLGTPHCSGRQVGWFLIDEANRLAPGAPYADRIRYRTVIGRWLQGRREGSYAEQRAHRTYRFFGGRGDSWGDGVVPLESASLTGVDNLVLDDVAHSRKFYRNWYGSSAQIIRRWWPEGTWYDG